MCLWLFCLLLDSFPSIGSPCSTLLLGLLPSLTVSCFVMVCCCHPKGCSFLKCNRRSGYRGTLQSDRFQWFQVTLTLAFILQLHKTIDGYLKRPLFKIRLPSIPSWLFKEMFSNISSTYIIKRNARGHLCHTWIAWKPSCFEWMLKTNKRHIISEPKTNIFYFTSFGS